MYNEDYSKKLLSQLIFRFKKKARLRKHIPIIIVFPQPQDIKLKSSSLYFKKFFEKLGEKIEIIEISKFINDKNYKKYYLDDKYGGHFSKAGNLKIAKIILNQLKMKYKKILS